MTRPVDASECTFFDEEREATRPFTPPDPRDGLILALRAEVERLKADAQNALDNAIREIDRQRAEIVKLRTVVDAARDLSAKYATSGDPQFVLLRAALRALDEAPPDAVGRDR